MIHINKNHHSTGSILKPKCFLRYEKVEISCVRACHRGRTTCQSLKRFGYRADTGLFTNTKGEKVLHPPVYMCCATVKLLLVFLCYILCCNNTAFESCLNADHEKVDIKRVIWLFVMLQNHKALISEFYPRWRQFFISLLRPVLLLLSQATAGLLIHPAGTQHGGTVLKRRGKTQIMSLTVAGLMCSGLRTKESAVCVETPIT